MKMLRFKFQQNRTINKEFDFWGGIEERRGEGRGAPILKFRKLTPRDLSTEHSYQMSARLDH